MGSIVRVESRDGDIWTARTSHVSDRIIGLRGWDAVERRFRDRDSVTLLVGGESTLVSINARVLSAGGTLMRVVRRDDVENDRRRAPRLRVELPGTLSTPDGDSHVDIVDLSALGCAVRSSLPIAVGTSVNVGLALDDEAIELRGAIVRTWMHGASEKYAGVQFENVSAEKGQLLHRFLVTQLQTGLTPLVVQ